MSFDVALHQPPTTETTTRDAVSDLSAPRNPTGPSHANLVQPSPPTSAPAQAGPGSKKRKAYKVTKPSRSLSTPHVHGVIMSDAESDKKRNKLGYQRISIACAHCRRRKIRCLVAEGDAHGRCQNCIRLKKECAFYPVDQQGVVETTSQPSSASASGIASGPRSGSAVSSSTPPDPDPTKAFENRHNQAGFQTIPSNVPSDFGGLSGYPVDSTVPFANHQPYPLSGRFDERVFDPSAGAMSQAGPGLRQHSDTHSPWIGAGGFPYQTPGGHAPDYANSQYWRQNTAPSGNDYASYPVDQMSPPSIPHSAHSFAFSPQRLDEMWTQAPSQQPVRSMSHGQVEGFPQGMDAYSHFPQPDVHSSSMARHGPSSLEVQNASMMPPGPQSAPLRQEYSVFPDQQQFGMQHGNRPPKSVPSTTNPAYSGSNYHQSPRTGMGERQQLVPMSEPGSYAVHPQQPG